MSSTLQEIAAFLQAAPQSLGPVYIGFMPDNPAVAGVVYEYGGLAPDGGFGVGGVAYETPAVQVVFRGLPGDYMGPRTKAEVAYRAMAALQPGTLSGTMYLLVRPQQSPFLLQRDNTSRVYIACNFLCQKELSA